MTRSELDAALALANAATPGPWTVHEQHECECDECWDGISNEATPGRPAHHDSAFVPESLVVPDDEGDSMSRENATFIAASRTLVPQLVAEVLRWRRQWAAMVERHSVDLLERDVARAILAEEEVKP
jgi:hypothetical protein